MLSLLHIENIAVIECCDISFDKGFHVLTGETGAGKSIVIDAISALLGERAYRDMIRTGETKASVRGIFTEVSQYPWFEENNVPYNPETVIYREILADGRNICKVNGCPVTVAILKKLGTQLIDIHGQHDSASLFDEGNHLVFLDEFSQNSSLRKSYLEAYLQVQDLRSQMKALQMDESEKLRRMETLRYQIQEISNAGLQPDEEEALEQRRKVLQNAEKLSDSLHITSECLYGSEDSDGAAGLLYQAERELFRMERYTDAYTQLHEQVADLMYQAQDVAQRVRDSMEDLIYSPRELDEIESRLDVIHRLRRKYGATCRDILDYLENAQKQLDEIEFSDTLLEKLSAQLERAEKNAWDLALSLRESRSKGAKALSAGILEELSQLDMPKVQFSCVFTETQLCENGADAVAFYMSANVGEALKPMSKVASGGELARIMLAIKNVLSQQDQVCTLIFDEVDTGVSGRAAQKVAEKLKAVAKNKQVLCVTHLPQIAALGDTHMHISKEERQGRTYTTVTTLDFEGRKQELARIIGGSSITEITLKSAEEMLLHQKQKT